LKKFNIMNAAKELLKRFGWISEKPTPELNSIVDARYLKEYFLTGKVVEKVNSLAKKDRSYFVVELNKPMRVLGTWRWYVTVSNKEICKVY